MLTPARAVPSTLVMDTVVRDLRFAWRALKGARGMGLTAVLTLSIGLAGATTMFSVVNAALLRPPPFPNVERLVILYNTRTRARDGVLRLRWSWPHIVELRRTLTSFDTIASFSSMSAALSGTGGPEQIDGEVVSVAYFGALGTQPIAGRTFRPEEEATARAEPVAVVSARLWRRRFNADPSLVGTTIRVNDVPVTVVGILPDGFSGLSGKADVWIPPAMAARLTYADYLTTPQHFISAVARLKPGVPLQQANAELALAGRRFADEGSPSDIGWSALGIRLAEARIDATVRRSALVLFAAAVCVLVIACVNVAGLLLARGRTRRREMAIRLAIGSSRARIVQLLLTEGFMLAAVAGIVGTALAKATVAFVAGTAPALIAGPRNEWGAIAPFAVPVLDLRAVLFALAATMVTTVFCALVPALEASRRNPTAAIKEDERSGSLHRRGLGRLVMSEVALAVLLLAGAGFLVESFSRLQSLRNGVVADGVLTFWLRPPAWRYAPEDGPAIVERMLTRIQAVPEVESAAINRCTPFMTGCSGSIVFFPERPVDRPNAPGVGRHYVSADYFRTLGIPLKAGRLLTPADRKGTPLVTVVNETAARRFWPGEDPIGKRVWFGSGPGFTDPEQPAAIVGVVGDVKYGGFDQPIGPDFYTSYLQLAYPDTMVMVRTRGGSASVLPALRDAVQSVDAALPIHDVLWLDDRIGAAVSRPRFNTALITTFACTALLLAALGVYGMLSYSVASRMREIGVRLALGASARQLRRHVVGDGLRLAVIGSAIGLAAAVPSARLIQGLLFGAGSSDPRALMASVAIMIGVAGFAAYLPARRASAIDPIAVLRQE